MDEKDLYRGKCIHNNKWVYGDLIRTDDNSRAYIGKLFVVHDDYPDSFVVDIVEVDPKTVGRYTGYNEFCFSDKTKCKKIYEHDIVEIWAERRPYNWSSRTITKNDTDVKVRGVVVFRNGFWQINFENKYNDDICLPKDGEKIKRYLSHWDELDHYGWGHFHSEEYLANYIRLNSKFKYNHLHDIVVIGNTHDNPELVA